MRNMKILITEEQYKLLREVDKDGIGTIDDINKKFNYKIGKMIGYGKYSFVFEYEDDKVVKIKNNNNNNYNDYGFFKTYDIGEFTFNEDVLTVNEKHLAVYNDKLYYVIMEKLNIDKDLINSLDTVEFVIESFMEHAKIKNTTTKLNWLYQNFENDDILMKLIDFSKEKIFKYQREMDEFISIMTDLYQLFLKMKQKGLNWMDMHSGNFAYNSNMELTPFDMEF